MQRVSAGLGGEHDAAVRELRRTVGRVTGAAGALLAVNFTAAAAHLRAGQGALRALAAIGKNRAHDFVHDGHVGFDSEDTVGKLDLANTLARNVHQCNLRHDCPPLFPSKLSTASSLDRLAHRHQSAADAGNGTADQKQVALGVHTDDLQVLDRDLFAAVMTGELTVLEHAGRIAA